MMVVHLNSDPDNVSKQPTLRLTAILEILTRYVSN